MSPTSDTANEAALEALLADEGLGVLGVAPLEPQDDGAAAFQSVALIGPEGAAFWSRFSTSAEASDGAANPLDRWSRRVGERIAEEIDAQAVFPFGGPPYAPFLRWALASGAFFASPIGPLAHRRQGLWASFRFGLLRADAAPPADPSPSPCDGCPAPCKTACPVDAFSDGYDVPACVGHVLSTGGVACRETGCRARAACPVGVEASLEPARAAFHMRAFVNARRSELSL